MEPRPCEVRVDLVARDAGHLVEELVVGRLEGTGEQAEPVPQDHLPPSERGQVEDEVVGEVRPGAQGGLLDTGVHKEALVVEPARTCGLPARP